MDPECNHTNWMDVGLTEMLRIILDVIYYTSLVETIKFRGLTKETASLPTDLCPCCHLPVTLHSYFLSFRQTIGFSVAKRHLNQQ